MCGISGLYALNPSAPPANRAALRTICDHMTARGSDGHGEWLSDHSSFVNDLPPFESQADVIVVNRLTADLQDVAGKVYSCDFFGSD